MPHNMGHKTISDADGLKDICPIPIRSCIDSVDEEGAYLLLSLRHCRIVTPRKASRC
jgi:hypothetical protein